MQLSGCNVLQQSGLRRPSSLQRRSAQRPDHCRSVEQHLRGASSLNNSQKDFPEFWLQFSPPPAAPVSSPSCGSIRKGEDVATPLPSVTRRSSPTNGNARFPLRHQVKGYSYGRVPNVNSLICWRTGESFLSESPVSQLQ